MPAPRRGPPDVLLLGAAGWHASELRRGFASLGLRARGANFERVMLTTQGRHGLRLAGGGGLPGAVLVRSIPSGTFEQVTLRLGLLHALEALGVPVLNTAPAIERCVDKAATLFRLQLAGLPVPPSWTTENPRAAAAIVAAQAQLGHRTVFKPLFGSQGRGLLLLAGPGDLPAPAAAQHVWHLQRYVGRADGWQDFRVLVVAGQAVAAMRRHGRSWVTNVRQGGRPEAVDATGELARLAEAAARAVGAAIAGVDLIEDQDGRLLLLEVNSMPAWQALQAVSTIDLALSVAQAVVAAIGAARTADAA